MYKVTKNGLSAIKASNQLQLPQELTDTLQRISKQNKINESYHVDIDFEVINALLGVGFIKKSLRLEHPTDRTLKSDDHAPGVMEIKQKLSALIKQNQSKHVWDILMNLEAVSDKNGLIWLLTQVTEVSDELDHQQYQTLCNELMELADE